jgi:hypothetical protein
MPRFELAVHHLITGPWMQRFCCIGTITDWGSSQCTVESMLAYGKLAPGVVLSGSRRL